MPFVPIDFAGATGVAKQATKDATFAEEADPTSTRLATARATPTGRFASAGRFGTTFRLARTRGANSASRFAIAPRLHAAGRFTAAAWFAAGVAALRSSASAVGNMWRATGLEDLSGIGAAIAAVAAG